MTSRTHTLLAALALTSAAAATITALHVHDTGPTVTPTATGTTVHITEDDPRWLCAEMGNRVCGPDMGEDITWGQTASNLVRAQLLTHPVIGMVSAVSSEHPQARSRW